MPPHLVDESATARPGQDGSSCGEDPRGEFHGSEREIHAAGLPCLETDRAPSLDLHRERKTISELAQDPDAD